MRMSVPQNDHAIQHGEPVKTTAEVILVNANQDISCKQIDLSVKVICGIKVVG